MTSHEDNNSVELEKLIPFACHPSAMAAVSPTSLIRPFKLTPPSGCSRAQTSVRCSIAEGPIISPSRTNRSGTVDCVVVGGGISGLCIAQAFATKHRETVSNVIVTEARDRVGGNITTVERDGYLWEEGPNSFQPSDPILTMAVSVSYTPSTDNSTVIVARRRHFLHIHWVLQLICKLCSL